MRRIIKKVDNSAKDYIKKKDVDLIGKIINDFVEIDPDSFSFRYPNDKSGNNNLEGISHINIRNLHDRMDLLTEQLEKYNLVVAVLRDYQSDMHADYGPEMY